MSERDYLTPKEIAARCQVGYKSVLRAIDRGDLEAYEICGRKRVPVEAYEAWARARPAARPRVEKPPATAPARPRRPHGAGSRVRSRPPAGSDSALLAIEAEAARG